MAGEKSKIINAVKEDESGQRYQRSTISFPYMDLGAAMEIVEAIHSNAGSSNCSIDQIAAWTEQSAKSSGLRIQLSTTRSFGLIESEGPESYRLSPLGRKIIDPNQARKAKVEAFLNIPLYQAIFNKNRGGVLPPTAALERDIESLGVSGKQKNRARVALEKSAELAGFFEHGKNRLVEPAIKDGGSQANREDSAHDKDSNGAKSGGGGDDGGLHPFIQGLLKSLPAPESDWPMAARKKWLTTAENIFGMIYTDKNDISDLV